jgi:hypothetical protein
MRLSKLRAVKRVEFGMIGGQRNSRWEQLSVCGQEGVWETGMDSKEREDKEQPRDVCLVS